MILLTGASGFIGKHLLCTLVDKYGIDNVISLTSNPIIGYKFLLHHNYQFNPYYFIDTGYGELVDMIIHAGSYTPKNASQADDYLKCNQNIYNTEKLINANFPNLKKIIYLSTLDVYGKDDLLSESSLINPATMYGYSKLYCEKLVETWANQKNIICQVLRIGHVYGPGEEEYQKIIPITIRKIIKNEPVQIWNGGSECRSFIYIRDVVKAIINTIALDENIGPVNIVSGNAISVKDLVEKIFHISGKSVSTESITNNILGRNLVFDNTKMKSYLLATETELNDGLIEEWNYMNRDNGKYIL